MALTFPGPDVYPATGLYPGTAAPLVLPQATALPSRAGTQVRVLYGDLRTGRITGQLDATGCSWAQTLNSAGSIDQVTVPEAVVRRLALRTNAAAARTFLAVEIDDRMQEAGPIWSRTYDWEAGLLTLGAAGLWSLFDHRKIVPVLAAGQMVQDADTYLHGADYGDIARQLVAQAMTFTGGDLPLILPAARSGTTVNLDFPGWGLLGLADQLTQLTQADTAAPDITFRPQRNPADPRFIQWVMATGTAAAPQLGQTGADWIFDTTAPRSVVLGLGSDEDATGMGSMGWVTGNGSEADMVIASAYDSTLVDRGWPLLEQEENRPTVDTMTAATSYAKNLVGRSSRPVETWQVTVTAQAAREVMAGDYAQVITKDHPWFGTRSTRLRVQRKSGDLTDRVVLNMYPLAAAL